jgi:hypothetical protein
MIMQDNTALTTAQRKKLLLAQGAMFRVGLIESTYAVRTNLQSDVLAKSALNSLVTSASSALGHGISLRYLSGANFQTLLPIAISVISLLIKRRSLIKPLLIGAIALGTASAIARFAVKTKNEWKHRVASRNLEKAQHR